MDWNHHIFQQFSMTGEDVISIYQKKTNPVEEILGNRMREYLRNMITLRATIIDQNSKQTRLSFKLDQEGYVVQFPEPPVLTIVMPTKSINRLENGLIEVEEKHFKKACIEQMAKLKEKLVIHYGITPSLVKADLKHVYPEV